MSINAVVLKVASRCNLNCSYCYMYHHADQSYLNQPKIMSDAVFEKTMQAMLRHSRAHDHKIALIMHGGEPTLIGLERFRRFAETANERLGDRLMLIAIQTNALLITEEWASLFREFNVLVSVSIDGVEKVHDQFRVDHQGNGSYARTVEGIRILQQGDVAPRVISVANPSASGAETYGHFRTLGITQMDFLLPDTTHDTKQFSYGRYGETPIADFLIDVYDEWMAENDPKIKIRLFYNLLLSFMGAPPGSDAFGNPMLNYLIVNTDGSIEGTDALRVCDEGLVHTGLNVLTNDFDDLADSNSLLHQAAYEGIPLCGQCKACPEVAVCGGGHFPHRYSKENGFNNPSAWCRDIKKLFGHIRKHAKIPHVRQRVG
jgi:uncharacterized protein